VSLGPCDPNSDAGTNLARRKGWDQPWETVRDVASNGRSLTAADMAGRWNTHAARDQVQAFRTAELRYPRNSRKNGGTIGSAIPAVRMSRRQSSVSPALKYADTARLAIPTIPSASDTQSIGSGAMVYLSLGRTPRRLCCCSERHAISIS
jgi:hypothetical protein